MTRPWRLIASPVPRLHGDQVIWWKDGDGGDAKVKEW